MKTRISVIGNRPYKLSYPLDEQLHLLDDIAEEMTRTVEISDSAVNPRKSNANDIPVFLFFGDYSQVASPEIAIKPDTNKYYCRLEACSQHSDDGKTLSKKYPHSLQALANISCLHTLQSIDSLKKTNHPLPMTIVYQIGMSENNNHMGIVALQINSFDDPSQNEVMAINSLPGYSTWEDAAIKGIVAALKDKVRDTTNTDKSPKIIKITPEHCPEITQKPSKTDASGAIVAAMSCAISPEVSFTQQQAHLLDYMKNLTGEKNQAALQRDQQELLLTQPHPTNAFYNPVEVLQVLKRCTRFKNYINKNRETHSVNPPSHPKAPDPNGSDTSTPDQFIFDAQKNPRIIKELQDKLKKNPSASLFKICAQVRNPAAVIAMFANPVLMQAIEDEGKTNELSRIHSEILASIQKMHPEPDCTKFNHSMVNPYRFQNRVHEYAASTDAFTAADFKSTANYIEFKTKYGKLQGDSLKTKILEDFKSRIEEIRAIPELEALEQELIQSPEYKILKTAQDPTIRFFSALGLANTSSVNALEDMFKQQKAFIEGHNKPGI